MASKKKAAPKKVGFAALSKVKRAEMARKGGLARVAKAQAAARAEARSAKKATKKVAKKKK